MFECHPIPCWFFVDSPGSQCAGECHNNHNRVKQYDRERSDIIDWRKQSTMWYNITFMRLPLMDRWASFIWHIYVGLTFRECGVVHWWGHNHSKLRLPAGVHHTCMSQKCTWVHTSSGPMVKTPRMPRTANTSRLWSVTAYALAKRRPTDSGSILHYRGREDALPWMPMRFGMKRKLSKWTMALHV